MDQNTISTVETTTKDLIQKLGIEVTVGTSEKDDALQVTLESPEAGILIGHQGRNLEALQILIGQLVYKKTGEWTRVVVTVGDYRERQEKELRDLAIQSAERASNENTEIVLSDLSPGERRIVHMALADHPNVVSESTGEGRDRRLIIRPKT